MTRQKRFKLGWEVLINLSVHEILHLQMSIYFESFTIIFKLEKFQFLKAIKSTWNSSLLKRIKSLGKWNYEFAWKMAKWVEQNVVNMLLNSSWWKWQKCVFYFYFKTKGTLWQTQYYYCCSYYFFINNILEISVGELYRCSEFGKWIKMSFIA